MGVDAMKPGTTRDPVLAEWIRETAAKETYLGPHELRGLAKRWLLDALTSLDMGHYQHAHRCVMLAADLQAKALELENRYTLNRLKRSAEDTAFLDEMDAMGIFDTEGK